MSVPARSLRRLLRFLGPSWLTKDRLPAEASPEAKPVETDSRVLWSIALARDALLQRTRLGIRARFPGVEHEGEQLAPPDADAHLAHDRLLVYGAGETRDGIHARCRRAIDDHRRRGTAWAMLEQLRFFCTPHKVRIRLFNNHGHCYTVDRDGVRSLVKWTAWNWDNHGPTQWSRFWVVIYPTTDPVPMPWQRALPWGYGPLWGAFPGTWGSSATPAEVASVRQIVSTWKHDGSRCLGIVVAFDDESFDPAEPSSLPNGTWGSYVEYSGEHAGVARDMSAAYWPGT